MSKRDDQRPQDETATDGQSSDGARDTKIGRFSPSRAAVATGAVGLAVLLGGGAYLIAAQAGHRDDTTVTRDTGALAPVAPAASTQPADTDTASPRAVVTSSPSPKRSPAPTPANTDSAALRKKIEAARAAAAKDGHPLQRALTAGADSVDPGPVSTRTEKTAEGSIRIATAKGDLSGYNMYRLAGDAGTPAGDGHCTRMLRFSNSATGREMPTVLLCWRISAKRSVITLATAPRGKPSTASSIAVVDREWAKLG